jgi:ABC-type protease/lipase transport system fused ATPase/permease subunit
VKTITKNKGVKKMSRATDSTDLQAITAKLRQLEKDQENYIELRTTLSALLLTSESLNLPDSETLLAVKNLSDNFEKRS